MAHPGYAFFKGKIVPIEKAKIQRKIDEMFFHHQVNQMVKKASQIGRNFRTFTENLPNTLLVGTVISNSIRIERLEKENKILEGYNVIKKVLGDNTK